MAVEADESKEVAEKKYPKFDVVMGALGIAMSYYFAWYGALAFMTSPPNSGLPLVPFLFMWAFTTLHAVGIFVTVRGAVGWIKEP